MIRPAMKAVGSAMVAALVLGACASATSEGSDVADGSPVHGGTLQALQISEPRHFAPYAQTNGATGSSLAANAVFGTLIEADADTGELAFNMAESLDSPDGGLTLDLVLREGIEFTDGTPYNAEAVKFNWEQLATSKANSALRAQVGQIEEMEVVDDLTLRLHMVEPSPNYGFYIGETAQTWIASPTALAEGDQAFDANPVGAGPFVLESWTRQDAIELVRNQDYWDNPRPYLDRISLRTEAQAPQATNALLSGSSDLAAMSHDMYLERAVDDGLNVEAGLINGGQVFAFNTRKQPFDDIRARKAVALGINMDDVEMATYNGHGEVVRTVFREQSPYYSDIALPEFDRERAQELLDEIALDGEPLRFTITTLQTADSRVVGEALQVQLGSLDDIQVDIEIVDHATMSAKFTDKDFDMIISGSMGVDPDVFLYRPYFSESAGNASGISDPELDKGLLAGKAGVTVDDRKAGYDLAQRRLAELVPAIWTMRGHGGAVFRDHVNGVRRYAFGSVQADEVWLDQ